MAVLHHRSRPFESVRSSQRSSILRAAAVRLQENRATGRFLNSPGIGRALRAIWRKIQTTTSRKLSVASGSYPYFIQEHGKANWDLAPASPFTATDAPLAFETGRSKLDSGFFPARWERATKSERNYLSAMALEGKQTCRTRIVADRLGSPRQLQGPARAGLIATGLVYAPEHGWWTSPFPGWPNSSCDNMT